MKRQIRTPYFEIGTKNYIYGDTVLEYALAADAAAEKYDIDVLFITPAVEIRRVVEQTKHLIVLAPYMDTLRPGRGMADILPEALKAAGAAGVAARRRTFPPLATPSSIVRTANSANPTSGVPRVRTPSTAPVLSGMRSREATRVWAPPTRSCPGHA